MNSILRLITLSALFVLGAASADAQEKLRKEPEPFLVPIAERIERATVTDEEGLLQWAEFEAPECVNCKGKGVMTCRHCDRFEDGTCPDCPECHNTRVAVCRICAGEKTMPDILLRAPCPSCAGAGLTRCSICGGMGQMKVQGSGDKLQKCNACRGDCGLACQTCRGQRWVETPKMKPSVAEAKLSDLKKVMEALDKVAEGLATFESTGDGRKDMKAFAKVLAPGQRALPVLKNVQKHFDGSKKQEANGSQWTKYEDCVREHTGWAKTSLEYYLRHQKRLLELCIARAEVNEEKTGGKK